MKIKKSYLYGGIAALVVLLVVSGYYFLAGDDTVIGSIAVLPFKNLSGNPDHEFYADGMTEALIAELSKIEALRVISRTSIMVYKNSGTPLEQIARELNVDAVIKGSLRHTGDRIRATIELIQAAPERPIWANNYERSLDDILIMQEEVARDVAGQIEVALTPEEQARLSVAGSVDPAAHQAYLMGRSCINDTWTKDSVEKGISFFERAIELDPENGQAYAGLAKSYDILASLDWIAPNTGWPRAQSAALRALEIDETIAEAHIILADVKFMYDWDWNAAERDFKEAIKLSPSSSEARIFYTGYLMSLGRFDEAYNQMLFAEEHDPHSFNLKRLKVLFYLYTGQFGEARKMAHEILTDHPEVFEMYYLLGWIDKGEEKYGAAIEKYRKALSLPEVSPSDSLRAVAGLARTYALSGEPDNARTLLGDLVVRSEKADITPYIVAKVFAFLDETDRAFEWLEKAYSERSPYLTTIKIDPELASIHSDPRFHSLLKRMGLD